MLIYTLLALATFFIFKDVIVSSERIRAYIHEQNFLSDVQVEYWQIALLGAVLWPATVVIYLVGKLMRASGIRVTF